MPSKHQREINEERKKAIRAQSCLACGAKPPSTVSHIKTKGSGGGDEEWNLTPLCVPCHRYWEDFKQEFIYKHPHYADHLKALGWDWWLYQDKFYLRHPLARKD